MLGELLLPLIRQILSESAGKITGMLLEIDNTELLHILESHESLKAKVGYSFNERFSKAIMSLFHIRLKKLLPYFKLIRLKKQQ
jgi:hypothetical protein